MIEVLTIFVLQLAFQFARVMSTKAVIKGNVLYLMVNTTILQALWLVTTYIGVTSVMADNWYVISSYMLGGMLGAYLAIRK